MNVTRDWRAKALLQFVLANTPVLGLHLNHLLQRVNHRRRGGPAFLRSRIEELYAPDGMPLFKQSMPLAGKTVVEVGTGWDALPTLALAAEGARVVTYDHIRHLRLDLAIRAAKALIEFLPTGAGDRLRPCLSARTLEQFLDAAGVRYLAPADATSTALPTGSVDAVFTFAVFEHVPEPVAKALIAEARRILRPGGVWYALIGLHDHYAGFDDRISKVNFLRYSDRLWRALTDNRISFHNRLRERDFLGMLEAQGGTVTAIRRVLDPDDVARVRSLDLADRFRDYTPEELAVTRSAIAATFAA